MFHELRADVLPVADLGLQKAVALHYFGGERPTARADPDTGRELAAVAQRRHVVPLALARSGAGRVLTPFPTIGPHTSACPSRPAHLGLRTSAYPPRPARVRVRHVVTGSRSGLRQRKSRRRAGPGAAALEDIENSTRQTGSLAAPPASRRLRRRRPEREPVTARHAMRQRRSSIEIGATEIGDGPRSRAISRIGTDPSGAAGRGMASASVRDGRRGCCGERARSQHILQDVLERWRTGTRRPAVAHSERTAMPHPASLGTVFGYDALAKKVVRPRFPEVSAASRRPAAASGRCAPRARDRA